MQTTVAVPDADPKTPAAVDPVRDRFRGSLVGLAAGDALGATVEFQKPGTFVPPTSLVGGGPFKLKPGQWTDDTSQALCLAASLIECGGFDPKDCMIRLHRWMTEGYLSSTGRCFDIGQSTSVSLRSFGRTGDPYQGRGDRDTNGALMRLAPVPLAYAQCPEEAVRYSELSTRLTHGGRDTVAASRYFAALLVAAVRGAGPSALLPPGVFVPDHVSAKEWRESLSPNVVALLERPGDKKPVGGFGALDCLHAALWAVRLADGPEEAITRAVSLGEDADTVGAVAGQLAGAIWGHSELPTRWTRCLYQHAEIVRAADGLCDLSRRRSEADES